MFMIPERGGRGKGGSCLMHRITDLAGRVDETVTGEKGLKIKIDKNRTPVPATDRT